MAGMKISHIKLFLNKQISNWIESIKDETVKNLVKLNTIVSGGCITSLLSGEKINDYDIYFKNKETTLAVANYYVDLFNASKGKLETSSIASCNPVVKEESKINIKGETEDRVVIYIKSAGVASESQEKYQYFESQPELSADAFIDSLEPLTTAEDLLSIVREKNGEKFRPIFFSENAISLTNKVQLITRFYGEPSKIHDNYDFAHSMCYYDYHKNELSLHPEALECILSKTLIYKGSLYPVASIFRIRKFIERGWRISAGQILKILFQISELDLKNPDTLREQLIGVDQAYMHQLLTLIEDKKSDRVDTAYLAKLIDSIFDGY